MTLKNIMLSERKQTQIMYINYTNFKNRWKEIYGDRKYMVIGCLSMSNWGRWLTGKRALENLLQCGRIVLYLDWKVGYISAYI